MFCRIALLFLCVAFSLAVNNNTNCSWVGKSKDYNGNVSQTIDGEKCSDWADCLHFIRKFPERDFPDGSITAASNYCRDPIYPSSDMPWCFVSCHTSSWKVRRCAINKCNIDCYVEGQSKEYRGNLHTTADGLKCMDWNKFGLFEDVNFSDGSAEKASNYCRDPDQSGIPWCFGTDGHMDKCDVPVC